MNPLRCEIEKAAVNPLQRCHGDALRSYLFPDDFVGFSGHFPDYPILPAVLQVLLAQMTVEKWRGRPLLFQALKRAKFMHQLRPNETVTVKVTCKEKQDMLHCSCELHREEICAARFTLLLADGAPQ